MSVRREQGGFILDVGRSYGPHVSQVVESIYIVCVQFSAFKSAFKRSVHFQTKFFIDFIFLL